MLLRSPVSSSSRLLQKPHIRANIGEISKKPPAVFGSDLAKSVDWTVIHGLDDDAVYLQVRRAGADRRPVNSTSTANKLRSSSVHAQIRTSTGLFVLISHENWCLGLP